MNAPSALGAFWQQRSEQEKTLILCAAALGAAALVISLLIEPAWIGRSHLRSELPDLRARLAQMQGQSVEARQLAAATQGATLTGEPLRTALTALARQHALASVQISPAGTGSRAVCKAIAVADWLEWLDDARHQYRVRVSEAHVTALEDGRVDTQVTLEPA